MTEVKNLETYLCLSSNKYSIYLIDKNKSEILYNNEINIDYYVESFEYLSKFLDDNIFKLEKFVGKFIKNIIVIIDNNKTLSFDIGIKKNNYEKIPNTNYLKLILQETKDLFTQSYQDQKLMHMIVINYLIDGKNYSYLENDLKSKEFCLQINFISIPNNISHDIQKVLEKYQIKANKYLDEGYVKNFFKGQDIVFPLMINKILNGMNENEVQLVSKNEENKGIFEKFFQLFN